MTNRKIFNLAIQYLRYRQLRSWLTIISVIIGISLVATIMLLSGGLKNAIIELLQVFGQDVILILPGEEGSPVSLFSGALKFRDKDVEAVRKTEGVETVVPISEGYIAEVTFRGETQKVNLHAQPFDAMKIVFGSSQGFRIADGDWPESAREVALGAKLARFRFKKEIRADDELIIKGKRFTVRGVFAEIGETSHDNSIFMAMDEFRRLTGTRDNIFSISAKVLPGYAIDEVAENIRQDLEKVAGVVDFTVLTGEKAQAVAGNVVGVLGLVLTGIAIFTLAVGGVGIMNTMYTSVVERTRHIGVMKAVGATRRMIATLFVIESGLIGLVGGILGLTIGVTLAKIVEFIAHRSGFQLLAVQIQPLWLLGVLLFAFVVGVISGFLPAKQAAALPPAEALRYE